MAAGPSLVGAVQQPIIPPVSVETDELRIRRGVGIVKRRPKVNRFRRRGYSQYTFENW